MRNSILTVLGLLAAQGASAQSHTIAEPYIEDCVGAFLDSGGEGASGYQNNENYTSTICPNGGGPAISLQFITFTLSTAGTAPTDQLSIYDGPDTSYPLIGTWSGNDSPGIISASFGNTSGCLTLVFTSNETGQGVFSAILTCFQPCEPPTPVATMGESIPALVCQGEVLNFDATGSYAAAGFNVVDYVWNFDDGSLDSTSGALTNHSFDVPGEYVVQVTVIDDNDCESTSLVDLQILVSTTPTFTGTTGDTVICQGDSVHLVGVTTPTTWSAIPEANFGDGIYLPDEQGIPFNSSLTFSGFSPGSTLTDVNDLLSVCVSMEHSYMGDLVIFLTCPNGQSVTFHQQGGNGTFIGNALDGETVPPTPGECWEYCFSPTATNGTWIENLTVSPIPAGTYESVEPMSQLVGCPLNGEWTFTVVDQFAIDDGFLCSWELNFDPSLYPELTAYTPVLGWSTPDSVHWSGNGYTPDPINPLEGYAYPTTPGVYDYVLAVTDNFGCTYDTTITVTVNPSPQGPINITGDSLICSDGVAFLDAPQGFDSYLWSPGGFTGTNVNVQAGTYVVIVAYGTCSLPSEPFTVNEAPNPVPIITGPNFSCGGTPVVLSTTEQFATYLWSNGAQSQSTSVTSGSYTVTVTSAEGCSGSSDPYGVVVASDPVAAFSTVPNSPQPMGSTIEFLDGSSVNGGTISTWDWTFNPAGQGSSDQSPTWTYPEPGDYLVTLVVTTSDGCMDTTSMLYTIFPPEITIPNVISPNGDNANDIFEITNIIYWTNELKIYSRWGNVVYETRNYKNTWKGDDVPDGTYYYVLTLGDGREWAGHLTVLR
ncbi:MAG: PKD domain-containing protein [Flavobacteriales bacterium]